LQKAGYIPRCTVLNAAWYGVPQTRDRVVIIGIRRDLGVGPRVPERTHVAPLSRGHLSMIGVSPSIWRLPEYLVSPCDIAGQPERLPAVSVQAAFDVPPPVTPHLSARGRNLRYRTRRGGHPAVPYLRDPRNTYCRRMRFWNGSLISEA